MNGQSLGIYTVPKGGPTQAKVTEMINLDGMTTMELVDFATKVDRTPVIKAHETFPRRPKGYVSATKSLSAYAWNARTARNLREKGDIQSAMKYEGICDKIYHRLPEFARW